jgi:NitT/TauT family transport system substrate-binding protein
MHTMQSRRDFITTLSAASAAGVLGTRASFADQGPPEITTIRLRRDPSICVAPWYIAEDLLRAEGFTDVRYVPAQSASQSVARGELDFGISDAATVVFRLEGGLPITALTGLHAGRSTSAAWSWATGISSAIIQSQPSAFCAPCSKPTTSASLSRSGPHSS